MRETLISLLFVMIITTGCEKEAKVFSKDYPYIITENPDVNENGAVLYAKLLNSGSWKVLKYGFILKEDGSAISEINTLLCENTALPDKYSYTLNSGLIKGKTYSVRAYILTDKNEIRGNTKTFESRGCIPPEITGFSPGSGPIGTHVIIEGNHFAPFKTGNIVKFGNIIVPVVSASESRLEVMIPAITKPEKVTISVEASGLLTTSKDYFDLWFPWKRMNDFSEGYNDLVSFSANGKAYVGLGYGITTFWEYNPAGNGFIRKSDFPIAINTKPVCFSINNNGYVIFSNGHNNWPGISTISQLWEYNPIEDKWSRKADFPGVNRNNAVAFSIENKGYFGIGDYSDKYGYIHFQKDLWEYDPSDDTWTRRSDFPGADRYYSFGFSIGTYGYIGAGSTGISSQKSVYRYSPEYDIWTYIGEYPGNGDNFINGVTLNNKRYMGMGGNNSGDAYSDFWEFNPTSNSWKKMRSCPLNMEPFMAVTINNKGYLGIGRKTYSDRDNFLKVVFEFDPAKN